MFNVTGGTTYRLQAPIGISDTSIALSSFLEPITGTPYTMAYINTDIVYGTLDPQQPTRSEFISFTGITQNSDGTAVLTGVTRGLGRSYPFTADADDVSPHSGQSIFILSDAPGLWNEFTKKRNDESISGYWTAPDPLAALGIANKEYVDNAVNGGPVSYAAVIIAGVCGETITGAQKLLYLKSSDGKWYNTTAATASTVNNVELGISQGAGVTGAAISGGVLIRGIDPNITGLTPGSTYYAGNTAGSIAVSAGTVARTIGLANSAGKLIFDPYFADIPTDAEKAALATSITPPGVITQYGGRTAPSAWLLCDGSAVSRVGANAALFAVVAPSGVVTVTIASPAVFSKTTHGYVAGDRISLTTTGGLPSGLAVNTDYYVIAAGLTANAFEVALSPGGAAVNTSGSQSGVHTVYATAFGKGDGSTTFNLPDLRSKVPVGLAATAPTESLSFEPAAVTTGTDLVTILNTVFPAQGQLVQLTSTGTLPAGLSLATNYWIIRASATTIKFATSQALANQANPVNITDQGTGVHTMTYTNLTQTVLGRIGGEETHGIAYTESPSGLYAIGGNASTGGTASAGVSATGLTVNNVNNPAAITPSTNGSDVQHNLMQPFVVLNYIIKQ